MASYSSTENIIPQSKIAYFRKTGSMINHGTVERQNALAAYSLTEGYIGPNSVVHGTDLGDTTEYTECETYMQNYLDENWEDTPVADERLIITNSNKIKTMLLPGETNMQTLVNMIK